MTTQINVLTPPKPKAWSGASTTPIRVVVIDPAPHIPEVIALCLELCLPGATVYAATDGAAGLELIEREQPDMVIMDVSLPDRSGYALCQEIRQRWTMPLIMLSAKNQDVDIARGLQAGAEHFVHHIELRRSGDLSVYEDG